MRKTLKSVCLVLSALMILATAACASPQATDTPTPSAATTAPSAAPAESVQPSQEAKDVKLTVMLRGDNTPSDDNPVIQEIRKRTGYDVDIIYVPIADYPAKLSAMIAAGTLPDIFLAKGADVIEFRDGGLLADLTEYMTQENAPNILADSLDQIENAPANENGIYLVPKAKRTYAHNLNLRTDWLANLNMEMPTDLDSLYNVLRAFTYDDPDGNGQNDTFGLAVNIAADYSTFNSIFGAFGVPVNRNIQLEDGTVTKWIKHPQFLDAIEYIRKLASEGLIDPDWATIPTMEAFGKLWNGNAGGIDFQCVGPTNNWMPGRYVEDPTPTFGFATIAGPGGKGGVPMIPPNYNEGWMIASTSQFPEEALKLADFLHSPEGDELVYLGVEGVMFEWIDEQAGTYKYLEPYNDVATHRAAGGFVYWEHFTPVMNTEIRTFNQQTKEGVALAYDNALPQATIYKVMETEVEYGSDMDSIVREMCAQLIAMNGDFRAEYQNFIQRWNEAGGLEWEQEATAAYKAQ